MDAVDTSEEDPSDIADSLLEVWFLCVLGRGGSIASESSAGFCLEACVGAGECVGVAGDGDLGKSLDQSLYGKRNNTDNVSSK